MDRHRIKSITSKTKGYLVSIIEEGKLASLFLIVSFILFILGLFSLGSIFFT